MTPRDNRLRAARFQRPDHIPVSLGLGPIAWAEYPGDALRELMAAHPLLYPGFDPAAPAAPPEPAPWRRAAAPYTDSWGCVWETNRDGLTGAVTRPALASWEDMASWVPPSPEEHNGWVPVDWTAIAASLERAGKRGELRAGGLRHGHTFLTLTYLRGYQNLILDMADDEPRLWRLLEIVEAFNAGLVARYLDLGVEWMGYPEDLGMQEGPMLSPAHMARFIAPAYRRLMAPARAAGCVIHMHSDGDVRALADQLLAAGVEVLNIQDLVNGLDWMAAELKDRVCIDLDLDRQSLTRFGTPADIDAHVCRCVAQLGSREGGLMLTYGLHPGVPLENLAALMDAMERYAGYWS